MKRAARRLKNPYYGEIGRLLREAILSVEASPVKKATSGRKYTARKLRAFAEYEKTGSFDLAFPIGIPNFSTLRGKNLVTAKANFRRAYRRFRDAEKKACHNSIVARSTIGSKQSILK